ncbi:hypothetical protein [Bacillus sp. FJAT-22090]|uniref:hypothetical protein n=1 Tax=Bacillus sp. FJAT-22090 TaxID=1581038 RepID=UPI001642F1F7|nr:hypothetical protein [Bacillus sp. FJAT-22090]
MKVYVVSVIFGNNTSKIKYAGIDKEKAYSFTGNEKYTMVVETWENDQLVDTEIFEY